MPRHATRTAPAPEWMTTYEAAVEIGNCLPAQVGRWCKDGMILGARRYPGKVGWRIPRKAWENFTRSLTPRSARGPMEPAADS